MAKKETSTEQMLTFRQYALLFECCSKEEREEQYAAIKRLPRPPKVCGKDVPENLNLITYGQLDDLHDCPEGVDALLNCCMVILDVTEEEVWEERAERVLWFVSFCNKEVERINDVFGKIKPEYDPEEKIAGIDRLKFGSFGVLDWYAKRMGISDQEKVRDVPWVRIYRCMMNDNEIRKYERRLREVYKQKSQKRK